MLNSFLFGEIQKRGESTLALFLLLNRETYSDE